MLKQRTGMQVARVLARVAGALTYSYKCDFGDLHTVIVLGKMLRTLLERSRNCDAADARNATAGAFNIVQCMREKFTKRAGDEILSKCAPRTFANRVGHSLGPADVGELPPELAIALSALLAQWCDGRSGGLCSKYARNIAYSCECTADVAEGASVHELFYRLTEQWDMALEALEAGNQRDGSLCTCQQQLHTVLRDLSANSAAGAEETRAQVLTSREAWVAHAQPADVH